MNKYKVLDKDVYVYDIESYPNYFVLCYKKLGCDEMHYLTTPEELKKFFQRDGMIIGFNNHSYDDLICDYCINLDLTDAAVIKEYSDKIINNTADLTFSRFPNTYDIMKWRTSDTRLPLKGWMNGSGNTILETPIPFDKDVSEEQKKLVIEYVTNDVKATEEFYKYLVDVDSIPASLNLAKFISSKTNHTTESMFRRSTNGQIIKFTENYNTKWDSSEQRRYLDRCKLEYMHLIPDEVQEWMLNGCYASTKPKSASHNNFEYSAGGLHLMNPKFQNREVKNITNADVASYYPNLIVNMNMLGEFTPEFKDLITSRIKDKKEGRKGSALAKKLLLNSTFGILRSSEYSAHLKDFRRGIAITVTGQFILSNMANKIQEETDCELVEVNTDGVAWHYPNLEEDNKAREIVQECARNASLDMEFDNIKRWYHKDVNNFIAIDENNKIKRKGFFSKKFFSNNYIVPKIVEDLLVNNLSLDRSLDLLKSYSQTNPEYFTLRAKTRSDWTIFKVNLSYKPRYSIKTGKELKHPEEVVEVIQDVGHQLRLYAVKDGETYRKLNSNTGTYSKITNICDSTSTKFSLDTLDLSYYNGLIEEMYFTMTKGEQNNGN
jgi:hypothetical protein